jgi:hypothetical protein
MQNFRALSIKEKKNLLSLPPRGHVGGRRQRWRKQNFDSLDAGGGKDMETRKRQANEAGSYRVVGVALDVLQGFIKKGDAQHAHLMIQHTDGSYGDPHPVISARTSDSHPDGIILVLLISIGGVQYVSRLCLNSGDRLEFYQSK